MQSMSATLVEGASAVLDFYNMAAMSKGGAEVPEHIDWKKIRGELFQSFQILQKKESGERNIPIICETESGRRARRPSEEGARSPQLDEDGFEYAYDEQAKSIAGRKDEQDETHSGKEGGGGGGEDVVVNGREDFEKTATSKSEQERKGGERAEEHDQEMITEDTLSDKITKGRGLPLKEEDCTVRGGGPAVSLKVTKHERHWTEERCWAARASTGLGNEMNMLTLKEAGENKSATEEERSAEKRGERRSLSEDGLESLANKVHKQDGKSGS